MLTSLPAPIAEELEVHVGTLKEFSATGGGCINPGGKLVTTSGVFFLKWNDAKRFPGMFAVEADGLEMLRRPGALYVPNVVHSGRAGMFQFLLLEFISQSVRRENYWDEFGRSLAQLHQQSSTQYGLDQDNYIGSLRQKNTLTSSWIRFFIDARLRPQLQTGLERRSIDYTLTAKFEALFEKLPSLLPEERPSLLHGDLWSGNLMTTSAGRPCLIDPAVYFGHREVDLAMTQLFGGFDDRFFDAYNECYPLITGYEDRLPLYNLYPLLVHVNLFGGGYKAQVEQVLKQFVG